MAAQNNKKLNRLERLLPDSLLVDAAWLDRQGYSTSLKSQYVAAGWLEQPTRQVYRRSKGPLKWEQVVISLQAVLERPFLVGGRTALELQGFSHYLSLTTREVHLYGPKKPPRWLNNLPLQVRFRYHNSARLFSRHRVEHLPTLNWKVSDSRRVVADATQQSVTTIPWGEWEWPLTVSTPERAVLELLDELPNRETFQQVDALMDGLRTLSPRRLQSLLEDCQSIKVRRLFFFFADRHRAGWLKQLDRKKIDLGKGKRLLVKGGKLDPAYQITVPEDLNAAQ